jgi:multimeric flavodoxin WrbA
MKVLMVNGSPHRNGCTARALREVAGPLQAAGIEVEDFWIGSRDLGGCKACGYCETAGKCVMNDKVNEFCALADHADGFVFGSPVYYASIAGQMRSFLDRVFYSSQGSSRFYMKPVAGISNSRRAGCVTTYDQFNHYFGIGNMLIVSGTYWNETHGFTPEDVEKDAEGLRCMRAIGQNMAYVLRAKEAAKAAGVLPPEPLSGPLTNFMDGK